MLLHGNGLTRADTVLLHCNGLTRADTVKFHCNGLTRADTVKFHRNGQTRADTVLLHRNGLTRADTDYSEQIVHFLAVQSRTHHCMGYAEAKERLHEMQVIAPKQ